MQEREKLSFEEQYAQLPDLVHSYLEHVRVQKRLAHRTHTLYALDLIKLQDFARVVNQELLALQPMHIRRFAAQMHSAGRSARGIALILSGWRSFYRWAAQQDLVPFNPVEGVRGPKAPKPLPKALAVDDAVQLASFQNPEADPWIEARDAAMTELLYSCGLRVGELVGLDVRPDQTTQQQGRGWINLDAGDAYVQGKGGKRRSVPVGRMALQALQKWLALRARVGVFIGLGQMLKIQPRIDLRGGNAGVAQQLLHGPQITAGLQHMAGKRVAQHMRMHARRQPGLLPALLEPGPDGLACQSLAPAADEQGGLALRLGLRST